MFIFIGLTGCTEQGNESKKIDTSNYYVPDYEDFKTYRVDLEVTGWPDFMAKYDPFVYLSWEANDRSFSTSYGRLPWSKTIYNAKEGEFYFVYAQNGGGDNAWLGITATLKIDGIVIQEDEANGAYGSVSVGGYL